MRAHCIAYPIKYYFSVDYYFFIQNKARTADSSDNEFIVKVYLCMTAVHIISIIVRQYYLNLFGLEGEGAKWPP